MFGWVLPAYKMPEGAEHVKLMRITIREDFSMTMADLVIKKLIECIEWLDNHFTISKEQLEVCIFVASSTQHQRSHCARPFRVQVSMGRTLSRMDSNLVVAVEDLIRPC